MAKLLAVAVGVVGWLVVRWFVVVCRSFVRWLLPLRWATWQRTGPPSHRSNERTNNERTNESCWWRRVCVKHDMVTVACVRARVRACVRACVYVRACAAPAMVDLNTSLPVKATNTTRNQRADLGVMQPTRLLAARLFGSRYFVRPSHPVHDGSLTHSLAFACSVD